MSDSSANAGIHATAVALALGLLLAGGVAHAGTLAVTPDAAAASTAYGLRATVGTCAAMDNVTVPAGTINGPTQFEACETLTTSGAVGVASGAVTFRSGRTIGLGNGFSVAPGATFKAEIAPGISRPAYVQDDSPAAEKIYRALFYSRFDGLTLGDGTSFQHFTAYRGDGNAELRVRLKRNAAINPAENRLVVEARLDNDTYATNENTNQEVLVPAGWNLIEVVWRAAAEGQNNGSVEVRLDDGVLQNVLMNLDNDLGALETVRWGAVAAVDPSVTGFMELDEFTSSRTP